MKIGLQKSTINPAFGSNIIVSRTAYKAVSSRLNPKSLPRGYHYIDHPWTIEQSKLSESGFTEYASKCVMGIIKAKGAKEWFMFHLQPLHALKAPQGFNKVKIDNSITLNPSIINTLNNIINRFKSQYSDVSGFLVGGNRDSQSSVFLYEHIADILKRQKIDYSALLGQPTVKSFYERPTHPTCHLYYRAIDDTIIVRPPELPITACYPKEEAEKLKTPFALVKRATNDFIQISD